MVDIKKEELENLVKIKGEVRGVVFQTDAKYVLAKEGEEGLKKLEEKIRDLGYKIDYRNTKAMDWYPLGLRVISLLVIQSVFDWSTSEIREMGKTAPKSSFVVKFLFKLFAPLSKLVKELPRYWKEHYTAGKMEVVDFDEENKKFALLLKDFEVHPIFCLYLEGYIERTLCFSVPEVVTKETKCISKGDPYHEYTSTWK